MEGCSQQVKGHDPSLLRPGDTFGVLGPVLGSAVQERYGLTGMIPGNGHQDG